MPSPMLAQHVNPKQFALNPAPFLQFSPMSNFRISPLLSEIHTNTYGDNPLDGWMDAPTYKVYF